MDSDDRLAPEDAPNGKTTGMGRWWSARYLWYALAGLVVVALALPVVSTLQPGYYQRFPDLRVRMDEWSTSTHARMSCASCHIEPGASGLVRFAVTSIPAFYSQILRGPSDTNLLGAPSSDACKRCHTTYRSVSPDGDLLIPHAAHVEVLRIDCVVCHEQLVHHENPLGINRPSMTGCFDNCHDGVRATQECSRCHLRKNVPDSHQQDNWLEVHQAESEKVDCGQCHGWTPDYCDQCHKERPRTHEGNWKTLHAPRAAENSHGCFFCHDEAFCNECHYGITRPE